ncbi:MAG: hypothetical protein IT379_41695 [Deltaproteobacteria bacterium]|nr:hypothetical protein [Deltaproteobacteria bacterium]
MRPHPTALALALVGCSILDDRVQLPTCSSHEQCAALVSDDPSCLWFRCIESRCVQIVVDADGDGAGAAACVDAHCTDDDGACASRDCDDEDRAVFPGAPEICNGMDDDCNGLLDGPDEDDDRDGHADLCAGVAARDCDDDDPSVYVGARERCNGVDDDCFVGGLPRASGGSVPEPLEDADGDDHAAPDAPCESGAPDELPKDDCDDTQPTVHPGARELCDGFDNDCDGIPDDWNDGDTGTSCVPIDLATGDSHSCVRMVDDSVVCWGEPGYRLGAADDLDATQAQSAVVPSDEPLVDVAALNSGTCVAQASGRVRCWGPSSLVTPRMPEWTGNDVGTVDGLEGVSFVVGGDESACALSHRGVECWGRSADGAIDGVPGRLTPVPPTLVAGTEGANDIDASFYHACAVVSGRVVCWGTAIYGALGGVPPPDELTVVVPGIEDAVEVATGLFFTCVRHGSGAVSCFGDPAFSGGEACRTCPENTTPRPVEGLTDVVSIDAYSRHVCAVRADGSVWCWGRNQHGQLGDGTDVDPRLEPVRSMRVRNATRVETGAFHTCALTSRGVWCWGRQVFHRLGDGRLDGQRAVAAPASVLFRPLQLTASVDASCFRMPDLSVRCSGRLQARESCYALPIDVGPAVDIDLAEGDGMALCSVTARFERAPGGGGPLDRRVRCLGNTQRHAFLSGDRIDGEVPFDGDPIDVAVGTDHACLLDRDGDVYCWGAGGQAQLGSSSPTREGCYTVRDGEVIGVEVPCSTTPVRAELDAPATALAAGRNHVCAIVDDGAVACWGDNREGQLGRGSRATEGGVAPVVGLPRDDPATAIGAGGDSSCVALRSGAVWCWGRAVDRGGGGTTPRPVEGLAGVAQVALSRGAGDDRAAVCARLTSGSIRCVGSNVEGRLGGTLRPCVPGLCTFVSDPVSSLFDDAVDLACGRAHCCATRRSGQVTCWGSRTEGQRADGWRVEDMTETASTIDLVAFEDMADAPECMTAAPAQ